MTLISGKTTLLNCILQENHGERITVIENEYGEAGTDNELLVQDGDEQIVEINDGCICCIGCTVRGDLVGILGQLADCRDSGLAKFDRAIIETIRLADLATVAQYPFCRRRDQHALCTRHDPHGRRRQARIGAAR